MITNDLANEIIRRAVIISTKREHTKGCHARDDDVEARNGRGACCPYTSPCAKQFSLRGYVLRAAFEMGHSKDSMTARNMALCDALGTVLGTLECMAEDQFGCSLEDYNDREETTRQDVLRLLFSVPVALPDSPYPRKIEAV